MTTLKEIRANHSSDAAKRPRPRPQHEEAAHASAGTDRQGEHQRDPGRPEDDQDRRKEADQQVLEHVDEEVVASPVVDGRLDRQQQDAETAVEGERVQSSAAGS
jgi:hypothetical protein